MKKFLAILATLGISGTAIMSVVACGINPYTNPIGTKPNDPTTGDPTDSDNGKNDDEGGWKNGGNDSDSNREELPVPPITPDDPDPAPIEIKNLYANNDNIKEIFAQATKRTIYQDQYGFDQQYLDQQLFGGQTGLTPEQGSLSSNSSQGDFINYYLNQITGDVNLNGDKGLANALPFFDFLPSPVQTILTTVINLLGKIDFATPTTLLTTLSLAINSLGMDNNPLVNTILGYENAAPIKTLTSLLDNPKLKDLVLNINKNSWLDETRANYTLFDAQKIVITGVAWILGIGNGDGDKANVQAFGDHLTDIDQFDASADYFATLIGKLTHKEDIIENENYANYLFSDPETKELNQDHLFKLISNGYIMLSLFSTYLGAFNDYKVANPTDPDHVFSTSQSNWEVISQVRSQKLGELNHQGLLTINVRSLISSFAYYLGDLDKEQGLYRLQALLAIFFLDRNYGNGWKSSLNSGTTNLVIDWDDSSTRMIDPKVNTPLMTVVSKLIMNVIDVDALIPGWISGLLNLIGVPITNAFIQSAMYQLLLSFSTQKKIELSSYWSFNPVKKFEGGTKFLATALTGNGDWINTFLGWGRGSENNPLYFLFNEDIPGWLEQLPDLMSSKGMIGVSGQADTVRKAIAPIIAKMRELQGNNGQFNLRVFFGLPLYQVLQVIKLDSFDQDANRFAPGFASEYTDQSLSNLMDSLAEVANVTKMDNNATLKNGGIDINQILGLLETMWVKDEQGNDTNIITQFFTILKTTTGKERVNKVNDLLGIVGNNKYDTSKILGKLLIFLIPGIDQKPANTGTIKTNDGEIHWVSGDYRLGSPFLNSTKNVFFKIWNALNVPTNYDDALQAAWVTDQNNQAFKEEATSYQYLIDGDESSSLIGINQTITYQWTGSAGTVHTTRYTFSLTRKDDQTPFTLNVHREGKDIVVNPGLMNATYDDSTKTFTATAPSDAYAGKEIMFSLPDLSQAGLTDANIVVRDSAGNIVEKSSNRWNEWVAGDGTSVVFQVNDSGLNGATIQITNLKGYNSVTFKIVIN